MHFRFTFYINHIGKRVYAEGALTQTVLLYKASVFPLHVILSRMAVFGRKIWVKGKREFKVERDKNLEAL